MLLLHTRYASNESIMLSHKRSDQLYRRDSTRFYEAGTKLIPQDIDLYVAMHVAISLVTGRLLVPTSSWFMDGYDVCDVSMSCGVI